MIVVITSLELSSPLKFFALSYEALQIVRQLKATSAVTYRSTGFWTKHYTMTLWKTEEEMRTFARSGAHLLAMKKSSSIAKEIRTLHVELAALPSWKDAKAMLLHEGKVLKF